MSLMIFPPSYYGDEFTPAQEAEMEARSIEEQEGYCIGCAEGMDPEACDHTCS